MQRKLKIDELITKRNKLTAQWISELLKDFLSILFPKS